MNVYWDRPEWSEKYQPTGVIPPSEGPMDDSSNEIHNAKVMDLIHRLHHITTFPQRLVYL